MPASTCRGAPAARQLLDAASTEVRRSLFRTTCSLVLKHSCSTTVCASGRRGPHIQIHAPRRSSCRRWGRGIPSPGRYPVSDDLARIPHTCAVVQSTGTPGGRIDGLGSSAFRGLGVHESSCDGMAGRSSEPSADSCQVSERPNLEPFPIDLRAPVAVATIFHASPPRRCQLLGNQSIHESMAEQQNRALAGETSKSLRCGISSQSGLSERLDALR